MSTAPSPPDDGHTLRLVGLQHGGLSFDFQWRWPAGERTQWLDDVLRETAPAGPAQRDGLAAHLLLCSVFDEPPVWWLINHGGGLTCAVNGRIVSRGSQQRLNPGDQIEIGLTRLLVAVGSFSDGEDGPAHSRCDATHLGPEADGFDLAMLDVRSAPSGRADFSDLISLSTADAIERDAPCGSRTLADSDPLAALHAQYLAKLRNPLHVEEGPLWQDLVRGHQTSLADPVLQWMRVAGQQPDMDDLLGQASNIDAVIASLDALCFSDVLSPAPFDNVMHLFAPEGLRREGLETMGHGLPSLTRREHHSLSPDSAVSLFNPAAPTPDNPEPNSP
jgi:hypothetical protein